MQDNQTGSKGGSMRTGEFREQDAVQAQPQKKQDVTASLQKTLSHMSNIDKNSGLIYVIRINIKPELMGQSVYC